MTGGVASHDLFNTTSAQTKRFTIHLDFIALRRKTNKERHSWLGI